jgi:SAM-dependent methyltransferase
MNFSDEYATTYDRFGQSVFSEQMAGQVLRWLASQGWGAPPYSGRRVLDLACGTGAAALIFATAGCEVVGLEQSGAMLGQARHKAERQGLTISFLLGDMRQLPAAGEPPAEPAPGQPELLTPGTFDLITCFDSLNYLVEDGDLQPVCINATRLLRPGGSFIFDLLADAEFATWEERDQVLLDIPDYLAYQRLDYQPRHRLGLRHIVWFTRESERWWRNEENLALRAWRTQEIRTALNHPDAWLRPVAQLTPAGTPATADSPHIVYYTRKPEREE